uniref:Dolichyl-diphosphooligosaccharide--protein glycosyltransferase subunit STT3A n=1 Tax=Cacopsylla melanoneura TaxID=428564 RepID=A0A8D8XDD2_9HEMI
MVAVIADSKPAPAAKFMSKDKQETLLKITVLSIACILSFSTRLFSVLRFESVIHEFDPYFNYRTTKFLVEEGYYKFHNWFDDRAWYPLGRIIGGTIYPGLMVTSAVLYHLMWLLNITIDIRNVCVFLAPFFSSLTTIVTYLLTKEVKDTGSGLVAAAMIAIVPGYISRSVAGSYDNEAIAIFCMLLTYYSWIKAVKSGSILWAALTALAYFYMVSSWGGYVFLINLIPMHVLVLMFTARFSHRIYVAYSTLYCVGTILSMQIPFVGFQPVQSSEHMLAFGVFGLCQLHALVDYMRSKLSGEDFSTLFNAVAVASFSLAVFVGTILTISGKIAPWTGRFYTLLDPSYAKNHIPIIASVSEHQPTSWSSFFFDLQILVFLFPAGLYFCFAKLTDANIFLILYGVTSIYFAGVMVRLMLVLAPVMCILSGIAVSQLLSKYMRELHSTSSVNLANGKPDHHHHHKKSHHKRAENNFVFRAEIATFFVIIMTFMLGMYTIHCTWVTSEAYSSPSIVLSARTTDGHQVIFDDFREAYYWLRMNTPEDARVMSWWDYGYQITAMANRTILVDNNTWNNSHIALVGKAMSSTEPEAYDIMTALDVDYVLVLFGGVIGYSGDDINKFLWMVRIAEGEYPKEIKESDYFTERGEFRVDAEGSPTLLNCLMYKLSYYKFGDLKLDFRTPAGYDRTRNTVIGNRNFDLTYLEEAYTTEHWLVRIYRVKKPEEFNRPRIPVSERTVKLSNFISKKTSKKKKGSMRNKPTVIRGGKKVNA